MGGGSKSSSASTTQSNSEDNRAAGDNGAIVLGKDASVNIQDQFGDNVLNAFNGLISLAKDAGSLVIKNADQANQQAQSSVDAVTKAYQNQSLGTTQVFQNMLPIIIIAGVIIIVFSMLKKKE